MKKSEGKSHEASVEQCSRNNNLENTHLVLQEARGRKYNAAVQWGVPAVTADWLFKCDRTDTLVPEGPYKPEVEMVLLLSNGYIA